MRLCRTSSWDKAGCDAQAIATLGAVPHLLRLLESKNEVIAEGASETMLHIVTPSAGDAASHPSQSAVRAAGAIPSLLGVVRPPLANPWLTHLQQTSSLQEPCCWGESFIAIKQGICMDR